ncbi:N-alpha-acetyltransferase 25, NatB auxiliary subunit isoform 1-T1 [Menidia menidia]
MQPPLRMREHFPQQVNSTMAARGHVQDPNDRRLRPIYDYLDNGNNKMAIQQADKLLKKHKDLHCAKVLKAIGLQRTGKQDEAFSLAQEVATLEPTDDNSLQALTILYREMHRPELVTKLYEAAVKKVPLSEEYHSHLFMAYARVGEYKKMQQAGMALYKIVPKNPYYFWSVMSLVMQAISAQDEKLSQTMFLPLAERMVEKMVKEEKIEAEAEVQLYFMILERLGKCEEALEVIRGPLGEKLTSELQSRESKCMLLYRRLQRWPECNALAHKLLLNNPDDWQFYPCYFDSLFHLNDQAWSPPEEGEHCSEGPVHHTVAEVVRFVGERIKEQEGKEARSLRGPFLARLELIHRLRERGCPEESQLGQPLELMVEFFGKFGDKPCCITDLKIYLHLLPTDQHVQFINRLSEAVPLSEAGEEGFCFPEDTRGLQRHLCVCQLGRALGLQHALDVAGKLRLIAELKAHYRHGLRFGKNALKTELQFSDMYCLMAAHVFIDLWADTGDEDMAWQCLGVLQEGLSHSPSNAQFKLLLLLLYCRLGAFEPVVDLYSSLDAKHVQHDTIGFLLTRYAESLGQFAAASQSCNFSLRFFHSNQKDTSEYIIQAYKYGAFEKIPEFIALRNRLNQSLHFAQVRTERMLLDLLLEADIVLSLEESLKAMALSADEDDVPWDTLRDNRDLTVFTNWDPKDRQLTEEHRRLSVEEESLWLRIRSLTLRLLAFPGNAPHDSDTTNQNQNGVGEAGRSRLLIQLQQTLQAGGQLAERRTQFPFLGPPSTRLAAALASGSCQCQAAALQLSVHLQELEAAGLDESSELQTQICNTFKSLVVQLQEILNKCRGDLLEMNGSKFKTHPSLLESLVFFVETVSIVLWMASSCAKILRPLKTSLQKKKKKKKDANAVMPLVVCGFQELTGGLQDLLAQALEHIKGQEAAITALKLAALSLEGHTQEEASFTRAAVDKVQSSYLRSLQEVGDLLKKRAETIKNLKL